MPIQLPQVERLQPQATPSVGRANIQLPDAAAATAPMREGFNAMVKGGLEAVETYEKKLAEQKKYAIDIKSTELVTNYEVRYKTKLAEIKAMSGDANPAYQQLDTDAKTWQSELQTSLKDADPELIMAVNKKLANSSGFLAESRAVNQASQNAVYAESVTKNAIKLKQDDMLNAIQTVDAKDPKTFAALKARVDSIVELRRNNATRNGLAFQDQEGNVIFTQPAIASIKADVSDGIENVVKTLNHAGKTEEAKMIIQEYDHFLNAKTKTDLLKGAEEATVKKQALEFLATVGDLNGSSAIQIIEGSKLSPEVKAKALEELDNEQRRRANIRERDGKNAFERMDKYIAEKGFVSPSQLQDDPNYKAVEKYMSHEQKKNLLQQVEAPLYTKDAAWEKAYTAISSGELRTMKPAEFKMLLTDLKAEDRKMMENEYRKAQDTESKERSRAQYVTTSYRARATNALYPRDGFGKMKKEAVQRFTEDTRELLVLFNSMPEDSFKTPADQDKFVDDFYAKKLADFSKNNKGWWAKTKESWFNGGKTTNPTDIAPSQGVAPVPKVPVRSNKVAPKPAAPVSKPTQPAKVSGSMSAGQWLELYRKENGSIPSPAQLKEFKKKKSGQ